MSNDAATPSGTPGPAVETLRLTDDGRVPNSPLPALVYRGAVPGDAPAKRITALLEANGWRGTWVDGIFPFHHYHATAHEALVIASGSARVRLGGESGMSLEVTAGDAMILPAGTGHCLEHATDDLVVCGAYPPGQEGYDLRRAGAGGIAAARAAIARVPLPATDPVTGRHDPLLAHWA